jgi:hypothetical protein
MADNVSVSGVGAIKTDEGGVSGGHMQVVKLAYSADGVETLLGADVNGLDVDVTRVGGNVTVVQATATNLKVDASGVAVPVTDNAGSLTVDAPVATPVFVRLSDGSAAIAALPVTDNAASLTVDAPVATPVFVRLSDGSAAIAALPITDNAGSITVDDGAGSLTVDGTVTVNQGTPVAVASGWPMKITNGTDTVGISSVSSARALKVDVIQSVTSGAQTNLTTFVEASGTFNVIGGVYNETIANAPTEDQAAVCRITALQALHINIRKADGTELGVVATPLRTDPTGTTAQPVTDNASSLTVDAPVATPVFVRLSDGASAIAALPITDNGGAITVDGTVTVNQGATAWVSNITQIAGSAIVAAAAGIQKVGISDETGVSFSDTNPLPVSVVSLDRTQFTNSLALAASQTAVAIWTPASGKKFVITSLTIVTTVVGVLTLYDATDSATHWVFKGTPPVGVSRLEFTHPWGCSAANNVLRYTSGAGLVAELQVHGYEITP